MRKSLRLLPLRLIEFILEIPDLILAPLQKRIGIDRMGYVFVLPNLLVFGIFILFPMLLNFYYGFTSGQSILPENRPFTGTANFEQLLTCADYAQPTSCREDIFWRSISSTSLYVVFEVGLMIVLSLVTAIALNQRIRFRGFFRSVFFYPVLLSPVVVALIWKWVLQDNGVLNAIVMSMGGERIPFTVDRNWAFFWVIVVGVWAQMGFYTLILLAGLQSIPADLYEAAQVAGANKWQLFRFITMPLLTPTMTVVLVLTLIRAVQVFDVVFVLTGGGPGTATMFMVQYIYKSAFSDQRWGIAAAASLILAVVLLILTLFQLRLRRNSIMPDEEQA
jgi:alpha-1,4-digalacturonate transport system permease protein